MDILILKRGGVLLLRRDGEDAVDDSGQAAPAVEERDVSSEAVVYLFESVQLEASVTLGDVFVLVERCPALVPVFQRQGIEALCEQARLGPLPQDPRGDPTEVAGIEFLELAWAWALDTSNAT